MTTETTVTTETTSGPSRNVRRLPARLRAFDTARPWLWDTTVTVTCATASLVDVTGDGWRTTAAVRSLPLWLLVTLSLALTLPLYGRRRHPLAALAVMAAPALVSEASGAFLQAGYFQTLPLFHLTLARPAHARPPRTRPPRTWLTVTALLVPPLAAAAFRFPSGLGPTGAGSWDLQVLPYVWAYALAVLAGITVRSRRDDREREVRLAAVAERARIAREMHDIIGHNLSVVTGLADGGRYAAAKRPEHAAQALDAIATTSRQALAELRRVLGVLREEEPTAVRGPQPGLADLPALIDGVRGAGLPVDARLDAPPCLSPGAQLTVYRVVQEALTNTLKHAGPQARVTVTLASEPNSVVATVTDTAPTPVRGQSAPPGQGLAGMRERAALYDGTLECGPLPTGSGWRVRLRLPLEDFPS